MYKWTADRNKCLFTIILLYYFFKIKIIGNLKVMEWEWHHLQPKALSY